MENNAEKTTQPVSLRMKPDLYNRLLDFCESSGQSKTVAIERALMMYIDDYDAKMDRINRTDEAGK